MSARCLPGYLSCREPEENVFYSIKLSLLCCSACSNRNLRFKQPSIQGTCLHMLQSCCICT